MTMLSRVQIKVQHKNDHHQLAFVDYGIKKTEEKFNQLGSIIQQHISHKNGLH